MGRPEFRCIARKPHQRAAAHSPRSWHTRSDPPKLVKELPPIEVPRDSEWVQRIKFQSSLLTSPGHPTSRRHCAAAEGLRGAPRDALPGHLHPGSLRSGPPPFGFSPTPGPSGKKSWARQRQEAAPAQHLPAPGAAARHLAIGALRNTETGHEFYEAWIADDFPRVIAVTFQHPTPYFDDSYGVNSPNCGPYGDANCRS